MERSRRGDARGRQVERYRRESQSEHEYSSPSACGICVRHFDEIVCVRASLHSQQQQQLHSLGHSHRGTEPCECECEWECEVSHGPRALLVIFAAPLHVSY